MVSSLLPLSCMAALATLVMTKVERPNIVFVLADDLGFGDVGWNNDLMGDVTRELSKLARQGLTLSQYYVQQVCTPSRSALMTGMYPYHIGRQKMALKVGLFYSGCIYAE